MTPEKLYEMQFNDLPKDDRESLIKDLRGNRNDKQYKKTCAATLQRQMNFDFEESPFQSIPRRKNGSKLGLKERIALAIQNGLIEIRPLGIFYL